VIDFADSTPQNFLLKSNLTHNLPQFGDLVPHIQGLYQVDTLSTSLTNKATSNLALVGTSAFEEAVLLEKMIMESNSFCSFLHLFVRLEREIITLSM